jgi:hypothetical protein
MKIALCLFGQPRSFEKGYEYHKKNLLDHYDVDTFIYLTEGDNQKIQDLYKPIHYVYSPRKPDPEIDLKYTRTANPIKHPARTTHSMFRSMYMCSLLIGNSYAKYDWVIKSRTDYALNVKIPFEQLDNSKLYIPNCRMVPERDFGNDQFAFGSYKTMMKYMSTYDNIDEYYNAGTQFNGEDLMRANLHKHNLHGEKLVYVNMDNPFPPGAHNGTWHSLIRDDYDQWPK